MIYLTQLLCPQRHCLMGVAWDEAECTASEAEEQLRNQFLDCVKRKQLNPYCGICRSETLHCESARTRFETLEQATPQLRSAEAQQLAIAAIVASHTG